MLHSLLDTTQVLGTVEIDHATHEVCAEAVASHDRGTNLLTVNLRAFLRAEKQDHIGETAAADWLPASETVTEPVDAEEAHAMASDIFASWRRKVATTVPH